MCDWKIAVGLEVHVQLDTETKMFCACGSGFGLPPNSRTCPVCLGLPGALPVLNKKALELAVRAALALRCEIATHTKFDRKNYFYPDLPKGYQISQYDFPLAQNGLLAIDTPEGEKEIRILRLHLEEDAGKMIHGDDGLTSIDFNRAGASLVEIVSAPHISSPEEAHCYLRELKATLQCLKVSDCNMEEGRLRCDANVSVAPRGAALGTKIEIKNLNSFNYVRQALDYESRRQLAAIRSGEKIKQATFTWVEGQNRTAAMRHKEEAHDYRYFPEPDLGPFTIDPQWVESLKTRLPELPRNRRSRFISHYGLSESDAALLTQDYGEADYFEECVRRGAQPREAANWMSGKVRASLRETGRDIGEFPIAPGDLADLLRLLAETRITRSAAREIFDRMAATGKPASSFAGEREMLADKEILAGLCHSVVRAHGDLATAYRRNPNVLNTLVGKVMQESAGRADVRQVREILREILSQ